MKIYLITFCVLLGITAMTLLIFHIKTLKPIRSLLIHALLGLAVFAAINLTQRFTGLRIPVNWYTISLSTVFGIPGISGLLILNLIL